MLFFFLLALLQASEEGKPERTGIPMNDQINVGTYAGVTAGVTLALFAVAVILYCAFCRQKEEVKETANLLETEKPKENENKE